MEVCSLPSNWGFSDMFRSCAGTLELADITRPDGPHGSRRAVVGAWLPDGQIQDGHLLKSSDECVAPH